MTVSEAPRLSVLRVHVLVGAVALLLGAGLAAGVEEQLVFGVAAWASWVLPLLVLEVVLRRRSGARLPAPH